MPISEDYILRNMAQHQSWGFTFPTLSFFVPFFYWKKMRECLTSSEKKQAAKSILNFQLSWCFIMLTPFIAPFTAMILPGTGRYWLEYILYRAGDIDEMPEARLLYPALALLLAFFVVKILFCIIWATSTIKIKQSYERGDYSQKGVLAFPFFR